MSVKLNIDLEENEASNLVQHLKGIAPKAETQGPLKVLGALKSLLPVDQEIEHEVLDEMQKHSTNPVTVDSTLNDDIGFAPWFITDNAGLVTYCNKITKSITTQYGGTFKSLTGSSFKKANTVQDVIDILKKAYSK